MKTYHTLSIDHSLESLNTSKLGLDESLAKSRLVEFGPNALTPQKRPSALLVFVYQFNDFLIWILMAAGIISFVVGKWESSLVIGVVLLVNALLGTFQHLSAEKSLDSLKEMSVKKSRILRLGQKMEVNTVDLVPGDVLLLEAGDFVGADGRLIETYSLQINESALTGESESVHKHSEPLTDANAALGDRLNMVYSGSYVTYGRGLALVTATGMSTEIGRIADLLGSAKDQKTPLQQNLDAFGQKLAVIILVLSAVILALSLYRGQALLSALMFSVSLAVAAIPEALSAIVTVVLALGTQLMSKQNAIVRELHAVESLGAVTVICSDKTGTLTENKMSVQKAYVGEHVVARDALDPEVRLHEQLIHFAILCNDAVTHEDLELGDPTEVALVKVGDALGIDENALREEHLRLQELPFDSDRKRMSTLHRVSGQLVLITKGAVDSLLPLSSLIEGAEGRRPFTPADKARIEAANQDFSKEGLRVLAFGYKPFEENKTLSLSDEDQFVFLGLIAMMDPPRASSATAVAACWEAGIKPVMITGDHRVTAAAIASQIGILKEGDLVLEGFEVEALSDEALAQKVPEVSVYARVSPEHKIRIVKAWQSRGQIVAMTGDGVNDAPALRQANVGIAMGIVGTEVSKEAAAVVLTDDNFATIVKAIEAGRNIYNNIQSAILFLLSGNTAGVMAVIFTSLLALPLPFAPVHLLFINLVTDSLPAIAIGMEKHRPEVMRSPARDVNAAIVSKKKAKKILIKGLIIAAATLSAYGFGLVTSGPALAATLAFGTFCLAKLFHSLDSRSEVPVLKQGLFTNLPLIMAVFAGFGLLHLVLYVPLLHDFFEISPLRLQDMALMYTLGLTPLLLIEWMKTRADQGQAH